MADKDAFSKVVKAVCQFKGGSTYVLSKELGVSQEEVGRVLSFLLAEGFLQELRIKGDCSSCPLSKICPYSGGGVKLPNKRTVYVLTNKGKKFCSDVS